MKKLPVFLLAIALVLLIYGCTFTFDFTTTKPQTTESMTSLTTIDLTSSLSSITSTKLTTVLTTEEQTFSVTWLNDDSSVIMIEDSIPFNSIPTYKGQTPSKPSTNEYSYEFIGWSPSFSPVTLNQSYTAVFKAVINTYTVTWVNEDLTLLFSEELPYGTIPSYSNDTPIKVSSDQYDYDFIGWNETITAVTSNQTYIATFQPSLRSYDISWMLDDQLLSTQSLSYGDTPVYNDETPVKSSTLEFDYQFKGWSPEIDNVKSDQTYYAVFEEQVRYYQVTWVDEDQTMITSEFYAYGELPNYSTSLPSKPSDQQYHYEFKEWSPSLSSVQSDFTYQATYQSFIRSYLVTWVDDFQNVLAISEVAYGELPVFPSDIPTKKDNQFNYQFSGWSNELIPVTGPVSYQATFEVAGERTYTVSFTNYDGNVLHTEEYQYGDTPIVPDLIPSRASDDRANYTFNKWSPDIQMVTEDFIYCATYHESLKSYRILFGYTDLDNQKILISYDYYQYGSIPAFHDTIPTLISDDPIYEYIFSGWSPEITSVTGTQSYTATFEKRLITFTINFETFGGDIIPSVTLPMNESILSLPDPLREESIFLGWYLDNNFTEPLNLPYQPVSSSKRELTFYAKYEVILDEALFDSFMTIYMNSIDQMRLIILNTMSYGNTGTTYATLLNEELQTLYSISNLGEYWNFYDVSSYLTYQINPALDYISISNKSYTNITGRPIENRHFSSTLHGSSSGLIISFPYYLSDAYGYEFDLFTNTVSIQYDETENTYSLIYYSSSPNASPYRFNYHIENNLIVSIDAIVIKDSYEITASIDYTTGQFDLIKPLPTLGDYRYVKEIEVRFSDGITRWETNTPDITIEMIEDLHPTLSRDPNFSLLTNQIYLDSDYTIPYDFEAFEDSDKIILYAQLIE